MRVLDVFCGAGGMSTGLAQAGWEIVCAVDIHEPELRTIHAAHPTAQPMLLDLIGSQAARDTVVNAAKLLNVNAVVGGPPCQDFSTAGANAGKEGERNGFPAFIEIVRRLNPDVFIFENVPGLVSQHKEYFGKVLWELGGIGYRVSKFLLNSADYGVPQARKRIFCIGIKCDRDHQGFHLTPPTPTHSKDGVDLPKWRGWGTVIDWSIPCDKPATQIVKKHVRKWLEKYHPAQLSFQLVQQLGKAYGEACRVKDLEQPSPTVLSGGQDGGRADLVLVQQIGKGSGEACRVKDIDQPAATVRAEDGKGGRADMLVVRLDGSDAHPNGAPVFTPDRPSPSQSINPGTVLVSGKQGSQVYAPPVTTPDWPSLTCAPHHDDKLLVDINPAKFVLTTASMFNAPKPPDQPSQAVLSGGPHGGYNYHIINIDDLMQRHLIMVELAALQGFPPDYPFHGNKTAVRRQISNAVPPPFSNAIAARMPLLHLKVKCK